MIILPLIVPSPFAFGGAAIVARHLVGFAPVSFDPDAFAVFLFCHASSLTSEMIKVCVIGRVL